MAHAMRLTRVATVLLVSTAACATSHPDAPELDTFPPGVTGITAVSYYDVHGRTAQEILADMARQARSNQATGFFAETTTPMRWTWRSRGSGSCTVDQVQVSLRSEVTLPRWTPPPDTVPGVAAQWNAFMAALALHESGHKDISARHAVELRNALRDIHTFCNGVAQEVDRIAQEILARSAADQKRYDAETRHGVTQGAVFPARGTRTAAPVQPPVT